LAAEWFAHHTAFALYTKTPANTVRLSAHAEALMVGGHCSSRRFTTEALPLPWLPPRALLQTEGSVFAGTHSV